MVYAATTGVILYWNPDQLCSIHRSHHVWFDEYNYHISIEEKHTPGSLHLRKYPEINIHNSDLLKLIPCQLNLTSIPFRDTTTLTYEIQLPPSGKKIRFDLLDDEYFTITYITDKIPNSPTSHQIPTQAQWNVWIIAVNGKEHIRYQGALDEINLHQTPSGKSKVNISLYRRKSYQRTYLEDICFRFDQVGPVVSHLEVCLPKKPPTLKNIGEGLKVPLRKFGK